MRTLYEHDKVKCLINIAHGEGFGLPLFEAARSALPIVTIPWSGQLDFLKVDGENLFTAVDYELKPVADDAVWEGVLQKDSKWAYADKESYQECLNYVLNNWEKCNEQATILQDSIDTKFRAEVLYEIFCNSIYQPTEEETSWNKEKSLMEGV